MRTSWFNRMSCATTAPTHPPSLSLASFGRVSSRRLCAFTFLAPSVRESVGAPAFFFYLSMRILCAGMTATGFLPDPSTWSQALPTCEYQMRVASDVSTRQRPWKALPVLRMCFRTV